jgi:hypothetical protein
VDFFDDDDPAPVVEAAPVMEGVSDAELVRLRAEVRQQVDRLRALEEAWYGRTGTWLACGTEADAKARMTRPRADWAEAGCWATLGYAPGPVVGGYVVSVDARGFRVNGWLDTDHDGNAAVALGTRELPATFTTPTAVR